MLKRNRSVEQERSSVLWEEAFPLQYPTEISGYAVLLEDIRQQSAKAEVERALLLRRSSD